VKTALYMNAQVILLLRVAGKVTVVTIHVCHKYDVLQAVAPVYYIMKQMIRKQRVMELLVRLHNFSVYSGHLLHHLDQQEILPTHI